MYYGIPKGTYTSNLRNIKDTLINAGGYLKQVFVNYNGYDEFRLASDYYWRNCHRLLLEDMAKQMLTDTVIKENKLGTTTMIGCFPTDDYLRNVKITPDPKAFAKEKLQELMEQFDCTWTEDLDLTLYPACHLSKDEFLDYLTNTFEISYDAVQLTENLITTLQNSSLSQQRKISMFQSIMYGTNLGISYEELETINFLK